MRKSLIILLLFMPALALGQQATTYTSLYTQYWPTIFTTQVEDINRTITIESGTITIATETIDGKEIQELDIREISVVDEDLTFVCLTRDRQRVKLVVPSQEQIAFMDLYKYSGETGEEIQIRFHLY